MYGFTCGLEDFLLNPKVEAERRRILDLATERSAAAAKVMGKKQKKKKNLLLMSEKCSLLWKNLEILEMSLWSKLCRTDWSR